MSDGIESLLKEERRFLPSAEFTKHARIQSHAEYESLHRLSLEQPELFWREQTMDLVWRRPPEKFLSWELPKARFFEGAELNISESCLDRHLATATRTRAALVWEGEPGETRTLTYFELHREVVRLAAALTDMGVSAGDRVAIYMGMVPEAAVAMLACARIGAPHSVVFGGFSADALRDRINDSGCKVLLTQDGAFRRGHVVPLKQMADDAVAQAPSIEKVVVFRRMPVHSGVAVTMKEGRDLWWHEVVASPRTEESKKLA